MKNMNQFSQEWPTDARLSDHMQSVQEGISYLEAQMQLPEDDRLHIAYGLEAIGGIDAAVLAEGNPGAGKTRFGNIVLGSEKRVDIEGTDTEDTLFGYQNPINRTERIDGKFTGKLTSKDPIVSANEISHLANTGPLHRLWDDDVLIVNGEEIPMANAAIYATSNFPNNQRVHELDSAIRSRFAVEVLFGDADSEFARTLHSRDLGAVATAKSVEPGIVPNPDARLELREAVMAAYPLNGREFGGYVTDVVEAINDSRMLTDVSNTDKRLSNGWQQAVRAQMLVEGARGTRIGAREAAQVAALVLPTVTTLSQRAKSILKTELGVDKIDPLTEAIVRRRLLAMLAHDVVEGREVFSSKDEQHRDNFRDRFSFAAANGQTDAIDEFVEKSLSGAYDEQSKSAAQAGRTRFLRRSR